MRPGGANVSHHMITVLLKSFRRWGNFIQDLANMVISYFH